MTLVLVLSLFVLGADCVGPTPPPAIEPASLTVVASTDNQTGPVNTQLETDIQVELRDQDGNALGRYAIVWSVMTGGGSVDSATTITNSSGQTATRWTLGTTAGAQTLSVDINGGGLAQTVNATAIPGPAADVTVSPASHTFEVLGETLQFSAAAEDEFGNALVDPAVTWSSDNSAMVSVDGTGLATAQGNGSTLIRASVGGASGSAAVEVDAGWSITVSPATSSLTSLGASVGLTAVVRDQDNNQQSVTPAWTLLTPSLATMSTSGSQATVTAVANGTIRVEARYTPAGLPTVTDTAEIVVQQVGTTLTLTPTEATLGIGGTADFAAELEDSNGNTVVGATYAWSTGNTAVATVSSSGALATVTAEGEGSTDLTVESGGLSRNATITVVSAGAADSVEVTPPFAEIDLAGTAQLTARAWAADGTEISSPAVSWSTNASGVATVSGTGLVTGAGIGVAKIAGTVTGVADTATVAVLGGSSLLSTAFFGDQIEATAATGTVVALPVRLDLSRVSSTGNLGSAQFELSYAANQLVYDSARAGVSGSALANSPSAGTVSFAFASTADQGSADLLLVTLYFRVDAAVAAGTVIPVTLTYTAVPTDTDVNDYSLPVVVTGTLRVTP